MPARWLPLLYYGPAHVCLASVFWVTAVDPAQVAGFFYHPRLLALTHLVTLGWISASILGSLYLIAPLALRLPLPPKKLDYAAAGCFWFGASGIVSHFWIDSPEGMAWSGAFAWLALFHVCTRILRGLPRAGIPREVKVHIALACINVLLAGLFGIMLGVNKYAPFLPHAQLQGTFAHAHLAALGWGTMMVMGAGYRLLPMILPAAMPRGRSLLMSAVLLQSGTLTLGAGLLFFSPAVFPGALLSAGGIGVFLFHVLIMTRHLRQAPQELARPDPGALHVAASLFYLAVSTIIGIGLAWTEMSEATLRWTMAYGVFGLVGFLSQIVIGVGARLLPLFAWLWGFADTNYTLTPPSQYRAPLRALQFAGLALWTLGVPLLATGLALEGLNLSSIGAGALFLAVVASGANMLIVFKRLWGLAALTPGAHVAGAPDLDDPGSTPSPARTARDAAPATPRADDSR
jgi:hypothetical protein